MSNHIAYMFDKQVYVSKSLGIRATIENTPQWFEYDDGEISHPETSKVTIHFNGKVKEETISGRGCNVQAQQRIYTLAEAVYQMNCKMEGFIDDPS